MSKHKKVKARKGWAMNVKALPSRAYVFHKKAGVFNVAVFILPADAASYDAMVEQGAKAIARQDGLRWDQYTPESQKLFFDQSRAALAAIGITRPKETKA